MRLFKLISIADIFTVVNALLGLISILATMSGWYIFALNMILLGVVADGIDGVFARRFSKRWYLGDYLDLMSDTVTFCVAPAVLMFKLYFDPADLTDWTANLTDIDHSPVLIILASGTIVVTGILRLARFAYQSPFMGDNFIGIPTPSAALTLSLMMMLDLGLGGPGSFPPTLVGLFALLLAVLMICDVEYLKLKGKIEWLAGGLIMLAVLLNEWTEVVLMVFIASLIYILGGPLVLRGQQGRGEGKASKGLRKGAKRGRKEKGKGKEKG